ncbi:hypothetical protein DPMN_007597 [Dreissena polymorpha]|uniref:BED-type domain-containing protein n=1 Tax=Dreissena polymorpha TaxID=45954 RepID=A0A9D4GER8_DREPO|nr:hypothetical protein DPMN_157868 [Dreissena polymorpha]KAH3815971.1 hypothetical protein DPMN_144510 [Dreissena polymorpha]KAH3883637.1 hypothetical protein DPMN_007597 [Dreissena polymorpha]
MAVKAVADKFKLSDAPKKLNSKVWQYFGFRDGSPPDKATCKLCFTDVAYPKSSSTTNLMQHVKRKHNVDLAGGSTSQLLKSPALLLFIYCPLPVSPEGTYGLRSVCQSVTLFWILR